MHRPKLRLVARLVAATTELLNMVVSFYLFIYFCIPLFYGFWVFFRRRTFIRLEHVRTVVPSSSTFILYKHVNYDHGIRSFAGMPASVFRSISKFLPVVENAINIPYGGAADGW